MKISANKAKITRVVLPFILFAVGYVFASTVCIWIHEVGHLMGALLTGSQVERITLFPLEDGQVIASYHSTFAGYIFFIGGFALTFFFFLTILLLSVFRKSKIAYFILFPLFMTFPTSWGDLKYVGFDITSLGAFILGWFVPFIMLAIVMFYYNIYPINNKQKITT
jgi:hypothetical protein